MHTTFLVHLILFDFITAITLVKSATYEATPSSYYFLPLSTKLVNWCQ
jgi:hypothetical protein